MVRTIKDMSGITNHLKDCVNEAEVVAAHSGSSNVCPKCNGEKNPVGNSKQKNGFTNRTVCKACLDKMQAEQSRRMDEEERKLNGRSKGVHVHTTHGIFDDQTSGRVRK